MLAKLSVLLGIFIAASPLGKALDCKTGPTTDPKCCVNLPGYNTNFDAECTNIYETGVHPLKTSCDRTTCIMKQNDHLIFDSKIDRATFTKFVKQNLTQFAPNIETSLEKCYVDTQMSKCTPQAFLYCVMTALMKECPSASWVQTEECKTLKTYLENCPIAAIPEDY